MNQCGCHQRELTDRESDIMQAKYVSDQLMAAAWTSYHAGQKRLSVENIRGAIQSLQDVVNKICSEEVGING